jgi:DNA polymerase I-like protein with 3'-5' exonuclease and polymerase domains
LIELDTKLVQKEKLPSKLFKSHSLAAWGHRLGNHKADYEGGFEEWSQEMEDYCVQDVETLHSLYSHLTKNEYSQKAIDLEHQVAWIIAKQERHGFVFDEQKAATLYATLVQHKTEIEEELKVVFKPMMMKAGHITPKKDDPKKGYVAGQFFQKYKLTEFNPGSRAHIAHWLKEIHGWEPSVYTEAGTPKVDESVLSSLPYPEAKLLAEYLMLTKRLGQLAEGDQAWLKKVGKDGRLHGSVITNGAVTGRATHNNPNMAQVPSCSSPYGNECRELFTVPKGKALVGADLSGLELRCLAHFMALYDQGEYGRILLTGDIHTANQEAAGLPTRNNAKTFIYAFLYGAGDEKIGSVIGKGAAAGKQLKDKFFRKIPAIKKLVDAVQKAAKRGYLVGLDGRLLHIRSSHAALNTLLQSAGALIAKQALIEFDKSINVLGLNDRAHQVMWCHDEIQVECDIEVAEHVGQLAIESFKRAGEYFNFRIPITGEYKVGGNWKETH